MTPNKIKKEAAAMAREIGLINVTKAGLCERVGLPMGSFQFVMGETTFTMLLDYLRERGIGTEFQGKAPVRANPDLRRDQILAMAAHKACLVGFQNVTRAEVARAAQVSPALVTRYFETMANLRAEIMAYAITKKIPQLIAQGLAVNDPIAATASPALKRRASSEIRKS